MQHHAGNKVADTVLEFDYLTLTEHNWACFGAPVAQVDRATVS